MNAKFRILVFALALVLTAPGLATAATVSTTMGDIELPTETTVQPDDLSSMMFRYLLGSAWTAVAGESKIPDRYGDKNGEDAPVVAWGQFSELLPNILRVGNFAAMTIVSGMLIYMSAIFVLSTAHEGKKLGGSKFNSMWVPVRWTLGYGLSVPMVGGLSLLQVAGIACVAVGINLANMTWSEGVKYIVANVDTSVSAAAPPAIENEARDLLQPVFQAVVAQEILKARAAHDKGPSKLYPNSKIKGERLGETGEISVQGDYVIEHRAAEGRLVIWFMPGMSMSLGSMGGVSIPAPIFNAKDMKDPRKKAEYDAMLGVSFARLEAFFQASESLREHARYFLASDLYRILPENSVPTPMLSGLDIANTYKTEVVEKAKTHVEFLAKSSLSGQKLANALGTQGSGVPTGGWMTAGVLPFVLATAQSQFDMFSYNGGLQFVLMADSMPGDSTDGKSAWSNFLEYIGYHTPMHWDEVDLLALRGSPKYVTQNMLGGRVYTGHLENGDTSGLINRGITTAFYGGQLNNSGMLSTTLSAFASQNPISAMVWFGDRLITIGLEGIGVSVAGAVVGKVTGQSWISEITSNSVLMFFLGATIVAGGIFCYVVPAFFMIVFFEALWPWVAAVMETLLASPVWAVTHVLPEGEGFAGQHARRGYIKLLDISIRPFLLVSAVFLTYLTIQAAAWVIHQTFSIWVNGIATYQTISAMSQFLWSILFVSCVFLATRSIAVNYTLKMPGQIISWLGGVGFNMGSAEQNAHSSTNVVGGVIGSAGRTMTNAGAGVGSSLNDKNKDKNDKKDKGKSDMPTGITKKQD